MRKLLKRRSGEGYIDVCVLVVCAMLVDVYKRQPITCRPAS